MKIVWDTEK